MHGDDVRTLFRQAVKYLESEQISIKELNVTETTAVGERSKASFVVSPQNILGWEQIRAALKNKIGAGIDFDSGLAALSLIGEGLNRNNLTLLEAYDLLARNEISVFGITTTSFRISLLVPRSQIERGVQLCHSRWIADSSI